jgi:hypothetical protein
MDHQRVAAMKIQRKFRRSRGYAAWKYSPQRLQQEGFFNETSFGKRRQNFIKEANKRSRRKGTLGTFGRWCKRQGLDTDGKVSLRCINKAKRSGNTKLIRRAVFAQNIKAYSGARRTGAKRSGAKKGRKGRKSSFGRKRNSGEIGYLRKLI